jgi:hypothetical protein
MALKALYRYLDKPEALTLKGKLDAQGIYCEIRPQGLPRYLGGVMNNFQVRVDSGDMSAAQPVLDSFIEEGTNKRAETKKLLQRRCPQCQSEAIHTREKISLFDKIRYYGVDVRTCGDCGGEWYV